MFKKPSCSSEFFDVLSALTIASSLLQLLGQIPDSFPSFGESLGAEIVYPCLRSQFNTIDDSRYAMLVFNLVTRFICLMWNYCIYNPLIIILCFLFDKTADLWIA